MFSSENFQPPPFDSFVPFPHHSRPAASLLIKGPASLQLLRWSSVHESTIFPSCWLSSKPIFLPLAPASWVSAFEQRAAKCGFGSSFSAGALNLHKPIHLLVGSWEELHKCVWCKLAIETVSLGSRHKCLVYQVSLYFPWLLSEMGPRAWGRGRYVTSCSRDWGGEIAERFRFG